MGIFIVLLFFLSSLYGMEDNTAVGLRQRKIGAVRDTSSAEPRGTSKSHEQLFKAQKTLKSDWDKKRLVERIYLDYQESKEMYCISAFNCSCLALGYYIYNYLQASE